MNPLHQRGHNALYKGVKAAYVYEESAAVCSLEAYKQSQLLLEARGKPQTRSYELFGLDETANKRLYAKCLAGRQAVHSATTVSVLQQRWKRYNSPTNFVHQFTQLCSW
ncbi:MAG: hypothetical protein HC835_11760 [Oscillatoriales cyanobacterium RM2_1_1]|nr:hypothetical protein [Oscillatoriales cyanobacterium SM2_3_0]NJO46247.1 hypothetical protein [Oscillatoriales cyanobacterium RM2_1_1]